MPMTNISYFIIDKDGERKHGNIILDIDYMEDEIARDAVAAYNRVSSNNVHITGMGLA